MGHTKKLKKKKNIIRLQLAATIDTFFVKEIDRERKREKRWKESEREKERDRERER
jgi:hypothetical protein